MSKHNPSTYSRETSTQKRYQDGNKARGLCQFCPNPAAPRHTLCAAHLAQNLSNGRKAVAAAAAAGRCVMCKGRQATGGRRTCQTCRDRVTARRRQLLASGICPTCGTNPVAANRSRCAACTERERERRLNDPRSKYSLFGGRPLALNRDHHRCRLCASDYRLTVHHIDGHGLKSNTPNHEISNLITLCKTCHGWLEGLLRTCTDLPLLLELFERKQLV